jgi:Flp pilus assembly protein TadD
MRKRLKSMTVLAVCSLLLGCAGPLSMRPDPGLPPARELLSGVALFDEKVSPDELPDRNLLGLDQPMRNFVSQAITGPKDSDSQVVRRLLRAMIRSGLLDLEYQEDLTLTAQEVFHSGGGNCLAFTNLFVAMAREAGLRVSYQQVVVPPSWSADENLLILNQHVNVLVHDTRRVGPTLDELVVDFNTPWFRGNYPQWPVSDSFAEALFYNNLAVDALRESDARRALIYFGKALRADPDVPAVWTNLGVLYQRNQLPDHAESAFRIALAKDANHKPAISNLAKLYAQRGLHELAAEYRERVRRHQERNPYFHFFKAEQAAVAGDFDAALALVDRAIRLRKDEHKFHFLRAEILARTGREEDSRASLERARDYATVATTQALYERKLREHH